ncbi:hypothetical protein BOVMAS37_17000 [Streptococcus uberis]
MSHKVFQMAFASIYQALVAKVERKGGQSEDVDALISWLMGYSAERLAALKSISNNLWGFH